ncbi:MAG: hypothetical protein AAF456_03940 [Planctomycetota bacterium]
MTPAVVLPTAALLFGMQTGDVMRLAFTALVLLAIISHTSNNNLYGQPFSFWTGSVGNWSASANWSNGVPEGDFTAIINGTNLVVTQDIPDLTLTNIELAGASNSLVLDQDLNITRSLAWADGTISGNGAINIHLHGGSLGGNLDSNVNNFGRFDFVSAVLAASPGNTAGPVWNNYPGSLLALESGGSLGSASNQNGTLNNLPGATIRQLSHSATYMIWDVFNGGTIEIDLNGQVLFVNDLVQSPDGVLHLKTPYSIVDLFSNSVIDGTIQGEGAITGVIELRGTISPGQPDPLLPFGSLQIFGGLEMMPDSILEADIGIGADRITVMHDATVGGTVVITAHDGLAPGTYSLVVATRSLGSNGVTLAPLPDGVDATLHVIGNELQLEVHSVATVATPDSINISNGVLSSGDFSDLADSDNVDLSIARNNTQIQSVVEFEAGSTSPVSVPGSLSLKLESSVFARSNVSQSIELFDFSSGSYETLDTRNARRFQDQVVNVDAAGNLSRFVEPGTNRITARVRYQSVSNRQSFSANVDQLIWLIGE